MSRFCNPPPDRLRRLLLEAHTVAVVGLSPDPSRPSYRVAAAMQRYGYRIVPVRPAVDSILGECAWPDLASVPDRIDVVDVFRAPEHVDAIVDVCIKIRVPALWLQEGVINEAAAARARDAGMLTIMDRCMLRDYESLVHG